MWIITIMLPCPPVIMLYPFCKLHILYWLWICRFFSPTWAVKQSRRNSLTESIDTLYICLAFLLIPPLGFYISQSFLSPVPFSDYSKTKSFPWVHHSVVDLTFCFVEKMEATKRELSTFVSLICTLKAVPIFSLLWVLINQPYIFFPL